MLRRPGLRANAGASPPEPERDRGRGDKRERIPVADRVAQPRDARAVGEERGDHLAEERPGEHETDEDGEPRGDGARRPLDSAGEQAEERECAVREQAVECRPGPVGRDRPPHRQADPEGRGPRAGRAWPTPAALAPAPGLPRGGQLPRSPKASRSRRGARRTSRPRRRGRRQERAGERRGSPAGELGGPHRRPTLAEALATRPLHTLNQRLIPLTPRAARLFRPAAEGGIA